MKAFTVEQMGEHARRRLPRAVFDYLESGAGSERGVARNRQALQRILFSPRALIDVSRRDLSINLFGESLPLPFLIAPTGLNGVLRSGGDVILARVAARNAIPFVLSSASTSSLEQVAESAGGNLWFQLYVMNRQIAAALVDRARDAGYRALVLTVDVPVGGRRPRDERNGFGVPFRISPRFVRDCMLHPRWALQQLRGGLPELANLATGEAVDIAMQAAFLRRQMDATFDWRALEELRQRWPRKLLVKGVQRIEDVQRCFELGVDGIILSNHGGRQIEDCPAPIDTLRSCPPGQGPLLVDSGFRTGADIVKALALGGKAVGIGRATLYGLAAAGEEGVQAVIDVLRQEIDNTLALIGCPAVNLLDESHLAA